jgi:subtilisin family serine protease
MKKKAKRRRAPRKELRDLRKLSPQLGFLLSLGLRTVRKVALGARAERLKRTAKIEERLAQACAEQDSERRMAMVEDVRKLVEGIGAPLVHGVYFPTDDELRDDAPVRLKKPYVSAFIKSQCASADFKPLGIRVRQQVGDIFTAFVPWDRLERLAVMPGIDFVELARPMRPDLSTALPYSQISNLNATGLNGAGVIVGILDDYIFFYHPSFRIDDGNGADHLGSTRVRYIWDQSLDPQDPDAKPGESGPTGIPGFTATYGVEYSHADIKDELQTFNPPITMAYKTVRHQATPVDDHGTHVSGIAAGNGRAQTALLSGVYPGAAPAADIIFVRDILLKNVGYADSTTVADAFAYVFLRATALGQPCVVNMSQSDNVGPHDGTSMLEQFLDELLLTPGRAITLAAGNATQTAEHTSGAILPPTKPGDVIQVTNVVLEFDPGAERDESAEIWYDGNNDVSVTLKIPIPNTPNFVYIGPIDAGQYWPPVSLTNGVIVRVVHTKNDPRNGDNVVSLFITNVGAAAEAIPSGRWTFELRGAVVINGAFEAWVDRNNRDRHAWKPADETSNTIAVTATGRRVIAVGAHDRTGPPPAIYMKSGVGPSRDNRIKPDITAVGVSVTSTNAQTLNAAVLGKPFRTTGGTSQAAPMVAGTVALLFQCRGASLTSSDIKQLLQNTAGTTVGVPSNPFGWGFLQAANLCAAPLPAVDVWIRGDATDVGVEPFTGPISWVSPDIELLDLTGNPVSNPTHDPTSLINNLVRVTVRNRGTQTARNVEVYLYWSDPATFIPFTEWRSTGIYTANLNGSFAVQSNKIVVQQLPAGGSTQVQFGWAPPAPGSNILGDDHFCLIARLEHEDDASNVLTGGWSEVEGSNNIAARNTHVLELPKLTAGGADTVFFITGSGDDDAIEVDTEKFDGRYELVFPVLALPWRDLTLLNRTGPRPAFGADRSDDPLADTERVVKAKEAALRTGIDGLAELRFVGGNAQLLAAEGSHLKIPEIRVKAGVKMPVRLRVHGAKVGRSSSFVHVRHRSGGKIVGGVTLELARKLMRATPMVARLEGGELVVRPL